MRQLAAFEQFGAKLASDLHDCFQHLVVAVAGKQDLARVELVQRAADRPHVDRVVVRHSQNNLGRSVEPTDQIRGNLVVRSGGI